MFIMLYACAGFTFWSESESCGKQFFEGKNMIGNIFCWEKKVTYMRTCHTRKHGRVTEESVCGATS